MGSRLGPALNLFGINLDKMARSAKGLRPYFRNKTELGRQMARGGGAGLPLGRSRPCLGDRFEPSGEASGHYFHQDLHVAQLIFANRPRRHIDVGSRVDGLVAHIASFREVDVLDIRELRTSVKNITFRQRDLMEERPEFDNCTDSLSCLHALEHFGLGRYGDPVNADGHTTGWNNLARMVEPGGKFYFSTPMGPQRVEFDAHRVFALPFLVGMVAGKYRIDSFAYVDDRGDLIIGADPTSAEARDSFGCRFGCAIFELTRLAAPR